MCEILAVALDRPEPLGRVLAWARPMERFGVAGFGWGVAWLSEDGRVEGYRDPGRLENDPEATEQLEEVLSTRFLVHLRRPGKLSTVQLGDTQPFVAEDGRFAFCHNGDFERHERYRSRFADRLAGRADSEVGFRLFEELFGEGGDPAEAMERTAQELGGTATLGYLGNDGSLAIRPGHPGNLVWRFTVEGAEIAATELHSRDSSLFELIFQDGDNRRVLNGIEVIAGSLPVGWGERGR